MTEDQICNAIFDHFPIIPESRDVAVFPISRNSPEVERAARAVLAGADLWGFVDRRAEALQGSGISRMVALRDAAMFCDAVIECMERIRGAKP